MLEAESTIVFLTDGPIESSRYVGELKSGRSGAVIIFLGTTREWTGGRQTTELTYHCYREMALAEMKRIAGEAIQKWDLRRVVLIHRLGVVPAGEESVLVGVSAAHRDKAYAANRYIIDTLKKQVPIWKRETYASGEVHWVEGTIPDIPGDQ